MKSISIKKKEREAIRSASRGNESVDKTLRRMLRDVTDEMDKDFDFGEDKRTNISISEDTYTKLRRRKIDESEPLARVIRRCIILYNQKHS